MAYVPFVQGLGRDCAPTAAPPVGSLDSELLSKGSKNTKPTVRDAHSTIYNISSSSEGSSTKSQGHGQSAVVSDAQSVHQQSRRAEKRRRARLQKRAGNGNKRVAQMLQQRNGAVHKLKPHQSLVRYAGECASVDQ